MKKALVIADSHVPHHDTRVLDIIKQIGKDEQPDYLVLLGDMFDANGISKFTYKEYEQGFFDTIKEIEQFRTEWLEPLIREIGKNTLKIKYCKGNHDGRRVVDFLEKLKEKAPEEKYKIYEDLINLEKRFSYIDFVEYNDCHKIGKLYFTHGEYHNDAHTKKHALLYGKSLMYGHLHTNDTKTVHSKATNDLHAGYSIPCSMKLGVEYMKNRCSSWVQGCAMVYFDDDGNFSAYPINIINNKTIYAGKKYSSKD